MLLFMVAAKFNQRGHGGRQTILSERGHRAVHMVAIGKDSLERRAGDHAASRTRLTRAYAFVIRIEQEIELRIEHAVAAQILFEDHSLEEPSRMREMPFRRAGVWHRLHGRVGVGERGAETRACLAKRIIERKQIGVSLSQSIVLRDTHAVAPLQGRLRSREGEIWEVFRCSREGAANKSRVGTANRLCSVRAENTPVLRAPRRVAGHFIFPEIPHFRGRFHTVPAVYM